MVDAIPSRCEVECCPGPSSPISSGIRFAVAGLECHQTNISKSNLLNSNNKLDHHPCGRRPLRQLQHDGQEIESRCAHREDTQALVQKPLSSVWCLWLGECDGIWAAAHAPVFGGRMVSGICLHRPPVLWITCKQGSSLCIGVEEGCDWVAPWGSVF